jgi:RNA polymerase sigma-70 factor (ECF subfamily)
LRSAWRSQRERQQVSHTTPISTFSPVFCERSVPEAAGIARSGMILGETEALDRPSGQPASLFPDTCVYFIRAGAQTDEGHAAVVAIFTRLRHSHEPPGGVDASDAILVSRAISDREAFAALYLRYVEEMGRFCFLRLRDEDAARDATQQIFAQALAGLVHYRETGQFRAWLYTIARHVLANQARGRHVNFNLDAALEAIDPGLTPEETATAALEQHALLAAVSRLTDNQQTAVELRLAGLTGPEIAVAMGRSHDAVKKLQLRALQRLRTDLVTSDNTQEVRRGA